MLTWVLVAIGGAMGSVFALLVLQRPTRRRLLLSTAGICALAGAFSAYPYLPAFTAPATFGFLGTASSMLLVAAAPPVWVGTGSVLQSAVAVTRRVAVYCAVGVTFALAGYLSVRAGTTLYVKFLR
ncbi:hypothetical protein MPNTM1_05500 [Mycolicibacterium parafortuitum]|uniref:hypothetical protein n=1 Tax=Mycolicibacterium parafortuitum TaxID=39692 RepID=UPI0032C48147